jgi:hypothetical protein
MVYELLQMGLREDGMGLVNCYYTKARKPFFKLGYQ